MTSEKDKKQEFPRDTGPEVNEGSSLQPMFVENGRAVFGYSDAAMAEAIVQNIPVFFWRHTQDAAPDGDTSRSHIGPMAAAFHQVTGLGTPEKIDTDDALGLALTALQNALYRIEYLEEKLLDGRGFKNQQQQNAKVKH